MAKGLRALKALPRLTVLHLDEVELPLPAMKAVGVLSRLTVGTESIPCRASAEVPQLSNDRILRPE